MLFRSDCSKSAGIYCCGTRRTDSVSDEIDKFNEDFNAGLIDPKELIEQLEEETKIKIKY